MKHLFKLGLLNIAINKKCFLSIKSNNRMISAEPCDTEEWINC